MDLARYTGISLNMSKPLSPPPIFRGQSVRYWPTIQTDPPTDENACIGMITLIDDAVTGTVRIGGFTSEGRPLVEGNQCVLVTTPEAGGWMLLG